MADAPLESGAEPETIEERVNEHRSHGGTDSADLVIIEHLSKLPKRGLADEEFDLARLRKPKRWAAGPSEKAMA